MEEQVQRRGSHSARMIMGIIISVMFITIFIIGFTVFDEPIALIGETFGDAYPDNEIFTSKEEVSNFENALPYFFSVAIGVGIIMVLVWFAVWGHKREYERY